MKENTMMPLIVGLLLAGVGGFSYFHQKTMKKAQIEGVRDHANAIISSFEKKLFKQIEKIFVEYSSKSEE